MNDESAVSLVRCFRIKSSLSYINYNVFVKDAFVDFFLIASLSAS